MTTHVLGICSCCGGKVCEPEPWYGMFPPTPRCNRCGARMKSKTPVIQTEKPILFGTVLADGDKS